MGTVEPTAGRKEPHEHCWHQTGNIFTSFPPQWDEVCCHCGAKERRHAIPPEPPPGCGPHHPDNRRTSVSWMHTGGTGTGGA